MSELRRALTSAEAERVRRKANRAFSEQWDVRIDPEGFVVTDPRGDCLLYPLGADGDEFPVYPWVIE